MHMNQNFSLFYNVCGAINILFELAANAFFSINASSLFRTLMKKDYNQEKFKLNHNVVMKLLQKSWGKVGNRAETKMRMELSIEIHTDNWDYNIFSTEHSW